MAAFAMGCAIRHNAFLEIALELGALGVAVLVIVVAAALWRSLNCMVSGPTRLGVFSLTFCIAILVYNVAERTLAQDESIPSIVSIFSASAPVSRWLSDERTKNKPKDRQIEQSSLGQSQLASATPPV